MRFQSNRWVQMGLLAPGVMIALNGCASVPPVKRTYYIPMTQQDITVTQTLGCTLPKMNSDGKTQVDPKEKSKGPLSTAATTVTTTYIADYSNPQTFPYTSVDGTFGDTDIAVGVTDDGRLSSINATGTGEAAAIIKSAVTLISAVLKVVPVDLRDEPTISEGCQVLHDTGTVNDKAPTVYTLTLNYKLRVKYRFGADGLSGEDSVPTSSSTSATTGPITYVDSTTGKDISAAWGTAITVPLNSGANPVSDKQLENLFKNANSHFTFTANRQPADKLKPPKDPILQPVWIDDGKPSVKVPYIANLNVMVSGPTSDMKHNSKFYDDFVLAPTTDVTPIPVPKSPWFGKIATIAQFGPSGIVEKLEYSKAAPLSDLMSSGSQIVGALTPAAGPTTAQQAAAVQAQSDLIYQQQRLVVCQLSPTTCPGK